MRWLGRGLLALIVVAILAGIYPRISSGLFDSLFKDTVNRNLPQNARASSVYWLPEDSWLSFRIQGRTDMVRLLNHVQLTTGHFQPEEQIPFAIRYRILDTNGRIIQEREYYFRTTLSQPRSLPEGQHLLGRFYDDAGVIASNDQTLFLDMRDQPTAATIALQAIELPPGALHIGVRAAQRMSVDNAAAALKWQRLSLENRAEQTDPHVYPHHLVSNFEILNQMSQRWQPLGPVGIEGQDFQSENLYLLDVLPSPAPDDTVFPAGLTADPEHWITLPLPRSRHYQLEVTPLTNNPSQTVNLSLSHQASEDLQVTHFTTRGPSQPDQAREPAGDPSFFWSTELTAGLLQVIPNQPVSVRLLDADSGEDLTPPRQFVSGFRFGPGQNLRYRLNPETGVPQPLRLDFRALHEPLEETGLSAPVTLVFRDTEGKIISRQSASVAPANGPYQRLASGLDDEASVSESHSLHLDAPIQAASVTIENSSQSNATLLLTLYSRGEGMPIRRTLPAQHRPWENYEERLPIWYLNQPLEQPTLIREKRRLSIAWFFQPIELNPALERGEYQWESLEPTTPAPQQRVMFPYQITGPVRDTTLSSLYSRIDNNASPINLETSVPGSPLQPDMVFSRSRATPATIRIFRNDRLWLERGIAGYRGRFTLPAVDPGQYRVRIEGEGNWYINHRPSGKSWLQRLAYTVTNTGLSFTVQKNTPREVVGFRLFTRPEADTFRLRVTLEGPKRMPGLLEDYTVRQREYTLSGQPTATMGIQGDGKNWSEPYRFSVPLGNDLPAGNYQIRLQPISSGPALATAFRILEGEDAPYRFFREVQSDEE